MTNVTTSSPLQQIVQSIFQIAFYPSNKSGRLIEKSISLPSRESLKCVTEAEALVFFQFFA